MSKQLIRVLDQSRTLYRDPKTGIAWVEDTSVGLGYSAHPNIASTGSIRGMKDQGYWSRGDRTVRSHGWIYNIDRVSVSGSEYHEIARQHCQCGGQH